MPYVNQQGGGGGVISGVTVTGTGAAGKVPVATSSTAGAWAFPPGFEIGYTQITAGVNIASTTEATGTTIISPGALTFDGGAVLVELFCLVQSGSVATIATLCLFEGATQITRFGAQSLAAAAIDIFPVQCGFRFTPSAASHTYTVTAFANSAAGTTAQVLAGAPGTGGGPPAYVRFTKV